VERASTDTSLAERDAHLARIEASGFSVIEGVFDDAFAECLLGELDRLAREQDIGLGPNDFEGYKTRRIYNLLAHGEIWQQIPVHDRVLPVVEGVLDRGCLISSLSSIDLGPEESAQMLHADDQLLPIARPHDAIVCNTMWALTDFSEGNGATRLIPGSHRAVTAPLLDARHESIAAVMPRGSVLVWHGSLWHGGGANQTTARRVGIAMNYCAGFIRQQENQQLGIPREIARTFSPRLRELAGYGVYNHLIGHIEKRSPDFLLGASGEMDSVWDKASTRRQQPD
jgi:ectoine hydroxylase-related dioxygenase (phytanoyl-CoA dioxygenase family)